MKRYDFEKAVYNADFDALTADERTVLVYMAYKKHWESDGLAFPSQSTVARETERSLSTVKRAFKSLRLKGWLVDTGNVTASGTKKYQLAIGVTQAPEGVTQTPGGVTQTPQQGHPDTAGGSRRPTNKTVNKTSNMLENKSGAPKGGGVNQNIDDSLLDEPNDSIAPKVPSTFLDGLKAGPPPQGGLKNATARPDPKTYPHVDQYVYEAVRFVRDNISKFRGSSNQVVRQQGFMSDPELKQLFIGRWHGAQKHLKDKMKESAKDE